MGFYGNITNTSRTQFSFDKIYPNKYEMFSNAKTDGIYVGRYVLVEYDLDTGADSYPSTLYKYGNDMYTTTEIIKDSENNDFILPPLEQNKVNLQTILNGERVKNKTIVRLLPGHNLSNINQTPLFIRITSIYHADEEDDSPVIKFQYQGISEIEYDDQIDRSFSESNKFNVAENFTQSDFCPGYFYIKNEQNQFEKAYEYDINNIYYVKGLPNKVYLCDSQDGFYQVLSLSSLNNIEVGSVLVVRTGCAYYLNQQEELWYSTIYETEGDNPVTILKWDQVLSEITSNYYKNFNIDKLCYPNAGRGYDSTVWQKVYATGDQYYIMIAELNTIIPNFDISSEAPTLLPKQPHFDSDTTNIYYKLQIAPQWGFRTKAASQSLLGEKININGTPSGVSIIPLTDDEIEYPSDVNVIWKNKFYNKTTNEIEERYYNPSTGLWELFNEENNYNLKSAIYFNKAGFNSEKINYSEDLINPEQRKFNNLIASSGWQNNNIIQIAPTGYSGYSYTGHNGSSERTPQVDTQELSIMIPALGDSVAQMWDIVYGGRETNEQIKNTNERNLDIFWEDASNSILRNGLRLINDTPGSNGFSLSYNGGEKDEFGNVVNLGEINTLAGCINSIHDLMGMILVNTTEEDLQNTQLESQSSNVFRDYKNIDGSKIYYFANDGTYRRKHETFEYNEVQYLYEPITLTAGTFIKNFYYYSLDNGQTFIPSYNDEFDENKNYYVKKIDVNVVENQIFVPVNNLKAFNSGGKHFPYQRTVSGDYIYDESIYAKDDDTIYYYVTNNSDNKMELSGDYEPNFYFYHEPEDEQNGIILKWKLEQSREASNIQYYTLSATPFNKNLENEEDMYDDIGIYLYCPEYFYYKKYDLLTGTPNADSISSYYKEVTPFLDPTQGEQDLYNTTGKIYVHLEYGQDKDYWYENDQIQWSDSIYDSLNRIVHNIYVETTTLLLDKSPKMTKDRQYYVVFKEEAGQITSSIEDENGNLMPPTDDITYNIQKYAVTMVPYLGGNYYRIKDKVVTYINLETSEIITNSEFNELEDEEKNNYQAITQVQSYELMTTNSAIEALDEDYDNQFHQQYRTYVDYYLINADPTSAFYGPNRYWYNTYQDKLLEEEDKDDWEDEIIVEDRFAYGDWIVDRNRSMTTGRRYYLNVIANAESGPYYHPNYYYYYDNNLNQYVLDTGAQMQPNITYYIKNNFYIINDQTGHFSRGAIWKYYNTGIPCTLQIGSRTSIYEMQELVGFSRTFNTIHGLILKINDLLELDDNLTRDTKTLSGCINTLNDIINKFDELEFNKILITDQMGRVVTKDVKDLEITYGPNNSKKMTLSQMLVKFEEIETKVDNLVFMTDNEMNTILNSE